MDILIESKIGTRGKKIVMVKMEVLAAFVAWWLSVAHQNFASVGSNLT